MENIATECEHLPRGRGNLRSENQSMDLPNVLRI
jgi:hypothetical protein